MKEPNKERAAFRAAEAAKHLADFLAGAHDARKSAGDLRELLRRARRELEISLGEFRPDPEWSEEAASYSSHILTMIRKGDCPLGDVLRLMSAENRGQTAWNRYCVAVAACEPKIGRQTPGEQRHEAGQAAMRDEHGMKIFTSGDDAIVADILLAWEAREAAYYIE